MNNQLTTQEEENSLQLWNEVEIQQYLEEALKEIENREILPNTMVKQPDQSSNENGKEVMVKRTNLRNSNSNAKRQKPYQRPHKAQKPRMENHISQPDKTMKPNVHGNMNLLQNQFHSKEKMTKEEQASNQSCPLEDAVAAALSGPPSINVFPPPEAHCVIDFTTVLMKLFDKFISPKLTDVSPITSTIRSEFYRTLSIDMYNQFVCNSNFIATPEIIIQTYLHILRNLNLIV